MSAIEQPAARSGRITCRAAPVRMAALSALQRTPQATRKTRSVRVLMCPDMSAGTLSAVAAAEAIAAGWAAAKPGDELLQRPLADGGPGFLDVVAAAGTGRRIPVATVDPLGRPTAGE